MSATDNVTTTTPCTDNATAEETETEGLIHKERSPRPSNRRGFFGGSITLCSTCTFLLTYIFVISFLLIAFSGAERENSDGGNQNEKPFIMDIAHGTSGTRIMNQIFCGNCAIPSMHIRSEHCPSLGSEGFKFVGDWMDHNYINTKIPVTEGCTRNKMKRNGGFCNATHAWLESNFRALDKILESGHVDGLADSPFPYFASYVVPAAKRVRNGLDPILIVTERNATEWTASRLRNHAGVTICQPFESSEMFYMDFVECYQEAVRYKQDTSNNKTDVHEETKIRIWAFNHFVTPEISGYTEEEARAKIADAFERQQANLVQMADYSINIFTQKPPLSQLDLFHKVSDALPQICELWSCENRLCSYFVLTRCISMAHFWIIVSAGLVATTAMFWVYHDALNTIKHIEEESVTGFDEEESVQGFEDKESITDLEAISPPAIHGSQKN